MFGRLQRLSTLQPLEQEAVQTRRKTGRTSATCSTSAAEGDVRYFHWIQSIKPKEKLNFPTSDRLTTTTTAKTTTTTCKGSTVNNTCERSGQVMRICVNLMPVLASAVEPLEEEDVEEEDVDDCPISEEKPPETASSSDERSSCLSEDAQSTDGNTEGEADAYRGLDVSGDDCAEAKLLDLPPAVGQTKPAPVQLEGATASRPTTLPPIPLSMVGSDTDAVTVDRVRTRIVKHRADRITSGLAALETAGISELMHDINPPDRSFCSKCRSPDFRLPDISLPSLDSLLQRVTQRVGRRDRWWACGAGDPLLKPGTLTCLTQRKDLHTAQQDGMPVADNARSVHAVPAGGARVRDLPPVCKGPKAPVILSLTTRNLLDSTHHLEHHPRWS